MMQWFFGEEENRKKLGEELSSWKNTPFRHMAGVKGVGVDCIHFVCCVLDNVGATERSVKRIKKPYNKDWFFHISEQKLYRGFRTLRRSIEVTDVLFDDSKVMDGDIILYQFGRAASHCGIYFQRMVWQSINLGGVVKLLYTDKFYKRRNFAFRIQNG